MTSEKFSHLIFVPPFPRTPSDSEELARIVRQRCCATCLDGADCPDKPYYIGEKDSEVGVIFDRAGNPLEISDFDADCQLRQPIMLPSDLSRLFKSVIFEAWVNDMMDTIESGTTIPQFEGSFFEDLFFEDSAPEQDLLSDPDIIDL